MCMGGTPKPPPASTPAAAPAPAPEAPVAPVINDAASNQSRVMAANASGRNGLRIDLASGVGGSSGGSGLSIPT